MAEKLELEDFSGGITDYYLSAPPNKMKECDNLLINQYQNQGKVFTRPGSEVYDKTAARPVANKISTCFQYKGKLYVQSADRLYYYKSQIINAGSFVVDQFYEITELGTTNFVAIGAKENKVGIVFKASGVGVGTGKARKGTWQEIPGKSGNNAFPGSSAEHQFTFDNWNYQTLIANSTKPGFPMKIWVNDGIPFLVQAGLPKFDGSGITKAFATGGGKTYLYKLVYKRGYSAGPIGDTFFLDLGTPSAAIKVENATNVTPNVTLNNIPVLANTADTNWDLLETKIQIYRTKADGTVYYKVGEIDNATTSFVDSSSDTTIDENEQLYTNGGVVGNDPPPMCRSIHIRNDIAYYGSVDNDYFRLRQSIVGDIDSVPESFYVDVDDEIVAVSSTKNNVIILCKDKVYRLDGVFDDLGRGGMVVESISDTAGCIGVNTAVQALDGVLWLGKDAVYFTDGFKVMKLNQDYDKTYKTFTTNDSNNAKYQGKYDNKKNRVWWTVQEDGSSNINKCYVLDLNWGIRPDATFTTISGNSFRPTAIEFVNGDMIRCDLIGYVFVHRDTLFVDPKINNSEADVTKWLDEVIVYNMETSSYNFGTSAVRKYVTQANVTCESTTNLALQIVSNNDDNRIVSNLLPIRYRGNILWGEPDVYWGDITLEWNRQGLIHEKRLMPAKNLRCNYKALKFTNAHVAILSSDTIGTVIINPSLKTATLSNTIYDWPDKCIGYFISFESDGYVREYEIVGRSPDILTFSDPLNFVGNGTQKWVIRGRPLGEVLNLLNVSVIYDIAGPSQSAFKVSTSGEVQ